MIPVTASSMMLVGRSISIPLISSSALLAVDGRSVSPSCVPVLVVSEIVNALSAPSSPASSSLYWLDDAPVSTSEALTPIRGPR